MIKFTKPEIVAKAWGRERVIHNGDFCGKILEYDKAGAESSFEYHLVKREAFYIFRGKFLISYFDNLGFKQCRTVKEGDVLYIPNGTPHQVKCLEPGAIFEASTRHDNEDSVRVGPGDSQRAVIEKEAKKSIVGKATQKAISNLNAAFDKENKRIKTNAKNNCGFHKIPAKAKRIDELPRGEETEAVLKYWEKEGEYGAEKKPALMDILNAYKLSSVQEDLICILYENNGITKNELVSKYLGDCWVTSGFKRSIVKSINRMINRFIIAYRDGKLYAYYTYRDGKLYVY